MTDPYIGRIIGDYELVERLGKGGMGAVYLARHQRVDKERALKLVLPLALEAPGAAARFEREARILARIEHPNVVAFQDYGELEDGTQYLVMERLRGASLAVQLKARGRPPVAQALRIFEQAASGLAELHRHGIIHRDISPDNIFLASTSRGQLVKLIDLGIALPADGMTILRVTKKGQFLGKLHYASPEQVGRLAEGESLDGRSDVYSLGVVMYETLCGMRPIEGTTPSSILFKKLEQDPPSLADLVSPDVPLDLTSVVMTALARDRAARVSSAAELIELLAGAARSLEGARQGPRRKVAATAAGGEAPSALGKGDQVGPYLLEEELGEGGMGRVFRARHTLVGWVRAVKLIRREWLGEPDARERFLREARALALLEHPNLVKLHECQALESGELYLVQELVEGESLKARLARQGRLEPPVAVALIAQAARGLEAAHERGLVHRDVSPDNQMIVVDPDGSETLKVIDFGIAKATHQLDDARLTGTGAFLGKLEYGSPEQLGQLEEGEVIDGRSDIYSLGVVLYEALVGRHPFKAPTPMGTMAKHLTTPPPAPKTAGVELPPKLEDLLLAMLEKDRARRPQTMAEVVARLESSLETPERGAAAAPAAALSIALTPLAAPAALRPARAPLPGQAPPATVACAACERQMPASAAFCPYCGQATAVASELRGNGPERSPARLDEHLASAVRARFDSGPRIWFLTKRSVLLFGIVALCFLGATLGQAGGVDYDIVATGLIVAGVVAVALVVSLVNDRRTFHIERSPDAVTAFSRYLLALRTRRWARAYSVLLPAAQRIGRVRGVQFDKLRTDSRARDIDSLQGYAAYWKGILWEPGLRRRTVKVASCTAVGEREDGVAALEVVLTFGSYPILVWSVLLLDLLACIGIPATLDYNYDNRMLWQVALWGLPVVLGLTAALIRFIRKQEQRSLTKLLARQRGKWFICDAELEGPIDKLPIRSVSDIGARVRPGPGLEPPLSGWPSGMLTV